MLSLFKNENELLPEQELYQRSYQILVSFLNKGLVPNWEDFFKELPVLGDDKYLENIKVMFFKLTCFDFLNEIFCKDATEYIFHGPENIQIYNLNGSKTLSTIDLSFDEWQIWLEVLSIKFKQNWNVQKPFVSFYGKLKGKNFRLTLIHGSSSPMNISKLVLRTLADKPHQLDCFGPTEIVQDLVKHKKNILIAGATGSGKTSFLTSLISLIDEHEHLIILEDTYEIISTHRHQTRLLAGETEDKSLNSYLAYSLRLSPDRIILGEMRSHEVIPFIMAMNTGHKGLMGTIHSSSAVDALSRVALLFSLYAGEAQINYDKVMELICRNLEYVVFMENKKIKEVIKILGTDKGTPFFETIIPKRESTSSAFNWP